MADLSHRDELQRVSGHGAGPIFERVMPSLGAPLEEVLDGIQTYRSGADVLPDGALLDPPADLFWIAYWYRNHELCTSAACRCHGLQFNGAFYALGGEGAALAAFRTGDVGVYSLLHARGEPPAMRGSDGLPWSRWTPESADAVRALDLVAGLSYNGRIDVPVEVRHVWAAWDLGMQRRGLIPRIL